MTCQSVQDALVELARDGEVAREARAAIDAHVQDCSACRGRLEREQQLSAGLRALAASTGEPPLNSSDAIGARLQAAFAEQHAPVPPAAVRFRWLQVAAVIALVVGAGAVWRFAVGPRTRTTLNSSAAMSEPIKSPLLPVAPAPPMRDRSLASSPGNLGPRTGRANALANGRARQPRVIHAEGFVQLPSAIGLPDFESGQIVRMELPVAVLPSYGIQIVPDARDSQVEADLLVGQDGQPRAIRLVGTAHESRSR